MDKSAHKRGFDGHLISQACGAINDNFFRNTFAFVVAMSAGLQDGAQRAALLGVIFMIPMIVLQPLGGFFADRIPMHTYIRFLRCSELALILLGIGALASQSYPLMCLTLFLLGSQSALYGPAKYAIIPQLVEDHDLEQANGQIQAFTTIAIITGTVLTAVVDPLNIEHSLFSNWNMPLVMALLATLIASLGIFSCFRIKALPAQNTNITLASMWNLKENIKLLHDGYRLWPIMCALSGFWFVGAALMGLLPSIAVSYGLSQTLFAVLSFWVLLGIASGSLLASTIHARSFPGAVPCLGAIISSTGLLIAGSAATQAQIPHYDISVFSVMAHSTISSFSWGVFTAGLGFGFIVVPLNTLLQQRSQADERGRLFAISGILGSIGTMLGFAAVAVAGSFALPASILYSVGVLTLMAAVVCAFMYRHQVAALPFVILMRFCYNVQVRGADNIPLKGGCLVVCNHMSYVDGLILGPNLPRHGKFLVYEKFTKLPIIGFFLRAIGVIPIAGDGGRRALVNSIEAAVKAAQAGEVVVIFPEGKLSRSGQVDTFARGMERIAQRAGVPVVPAYIDGLYGSIASRTEQRDFPRPRRPIQLRIGAVLPTNATAAEARQAVMGLSYEIAQERSNRSTDTLGSAVLKQAKRHPFRTAVIDDKGEMSYIKLCAAAKALIPKLDWAQDEKRIGILLPPGRAGAIINMAVAMDGRCSVNLNHTVGKENLDYMCAVAELKTVVTSKLYWRHIKIDELPVRMVFVEDLLPNMSKLSVIAWLLLMLIMPASIFCRGRAEDTATILFSSGSTGQPKGVQLSHRNMLYNGRAVCQHVNVTSKNHDRILNPLPYFHSFGLNVGLWLPLCNGLCTINQVDPRDGKAIGELCAKHHATFLISTPTFVRSYMRRIEAEQLKDLRFAMVGSEKCPLDLREQFKEKYNALLLEGYGCTELSPVVSANALDTKRDGLTERGSKDHSIGRPLPGIEVFTVDPESKQRLPHGESGLLMVRSPSRMQGYLAQPEKTAEAIIGDAYNTGDIGHIDEDGFLFITGRLARFAKVGGEMVPLDNVQEKLQRFAAEINAECMVAVAAVADPSRGERLIVMHTGLECDVNDLLGSLNELPPIFKPKSRDVHEVEALPVLGTGKLDLKGLKTLAETLG